MVKKIIITGVHGYISNETKKWFLSKGDFEVVMLNMREPDWENFSFEGVECIIHTAALVHKNEKHYTLSDYENVNTILTQKLAEKAKRSNVRHFIFLSTIAVYGIKPSLFKEKLINKNTLCNPVTKYGISKYKAELLLQKMSDNSFVVTIVRPPFIYGKNCPGNYNMLKKIALRVGVCPKINNRKSMLYIDNLCEFLYKIYKTGLGGTYIPQNSSYVKTYELVLLIAKFNNKKVICSSAIVPLVKIASIIFSPLSKAFGSEYCSYELSQNAGFDYHVCEFDESIKATEVN